MPRNVYSEIYLHFVWHTKESRRLIKPAVRSRVHKTVRRRALDAPGVWLQGIGGTSTHVHMAVSILPTIEISKWIGSCVRPYSAAK